MKLFAVAAVGAIVLGVAFPARALFNEQACERHIQETAVILDAMSRINLAAVSDQAVQNSIDFGAMAIGYIEVNSKKYCPDFVQITLKNSFLKRWNVWMEQLTYRKPAGYGGSQ